MGRKMVLVGLLAAALLTILPTTSSLANPPDTDEVKDQPGQEPPVTRGMPDLVRYWNFDPPKSPLFDISRVTISGDLRVRPELRVNPNFGLNVNTAGSQLSTGRAPNGGVPLINLFNNGCGWGSTMRFHPMLIPSSRYNMGRIGARTAILEQRIPRTTPIRFPPIRVPPIRPPAWGSARLRC